jgi:hypothetical protein
MSLMQFLTAASQTLEPSSVLRFAVVIPKLIHGFQIIQGLGYNQLNTTLLQVP